MLRMDAIAARRPARRARRSPTAEIGQQHQFRRDESDEQVTDHLSRWRGFVVESCEQMHVQHENNSQGAQLICNSLKTRFILKTQTRVHQFPSKGK
jgi:hypothetical protein